VRQNSGIYYGVRTIFCTNIFVHIPSTPGYTFVSHPQPNIQNPFLSVVRAMVVNAAQLATYSQAKQYLMSAGLNEGIQLHFCASM